MILHEMDDHAALKDALEESTLLINATSVGMVPDVTGTVIPDKNSVPSGTYGSRCCV